MQHQSLRMLVFDMSQFASLASEQGVAKITFKILGIRVSQYMSSQLKDNLQKKTINTKYKIK